MIRKLLPTPGFKPTTFHCMSSCLGSTFHTFPIDHFAPIGSQYSREPSRGLKNHQHHCSGTYTQFTQSTASNLITLFINRNTICTQIRRMQFWQESNLIKMISWVLKMIDHRQQISIFTQQSFRSVRTKINKNSVKNKTDLLEKFFLS